MLEVTGVQKNDIFTVSIHGELALESIRQFTAATGKIPPGIQRVEVDCQALTFVDSTGLNALLQTVLRWQGMNLHVDVVNLAEDLREMLDILGFFDVLAEQTPRNQ